MKYVILIGDGMSDHAIESLGNLTPLEKAPTPNMDRLAASGKLGLFNSVPEGYPPGSDVANLSILGYNPEKYYTGRAPLEAASMGVDLAPGEVAFRCNLVSFRPEAGALLMHDYSAGHISTEEASEIVLSLDKELSGRGVKFYPGKSYRHLMVQIGGSVDIETTPPHDISDRDVAGHLPKGEGAEALIALMEDSERILKKHPVNLKRREEGKNTADSIWLWGEGLAPSMETLSERFGLKGSMISAVDLMNGIGTYAGLDIINVPGVTGYIDTNYAGKVDYALSSLEDNDFICVHVEAPDEAGHQGSLADKLKAIEDFDKLVVGPMLDGLASFGDFRLLVLPDHPTPVELKTHTREPVPFVFFSSVENTLADAGSGGVAFTEKDAATSNVVVESSDVMASLFFL